MENIKMVILDVDGTMTDGRLILDNGDNFSKNFSAKDGFAINVWIALGGKVGIITGKTSNIVEKRAKELGIVSVIQGSKNKVKDLKIILKENELKADEIAYMGDDLNDLGILSVVGFSGAPSDAAVEVLETVDFIAKSKAGKGAVRDFFEFIMKRNGMWQKIIDHYMSEVSE